MTGGRVGMERRVLFFFSCRCCCRIGFIAMDVAFFLCSRVQSAHDVKLTWI